MSADGRAAGLEHECFDQVMPRAGGAHLDGVHRQVPVTLRLAGQRFAGDGASSLAAPTLALEDVADVDELIGRAHRTRIDGRRPDVDACSHQVGVGVADVLLGTASGRHLSQQRAALHAVVDASCTQRRTVRSCRPCGSAAPKRTDTMHGPLVDGAPAYAAPPVTRRSGLATRPAVRAARRDDFVEVLHGHEVADPYRWLEGPADDPAIAAFVAEQNRYSFARLDQLPAQQAFRRRLRALWDHPRRGAPWRRDRHWFQLRNDGLQNQDVLWTATAGANDADTLPPDDAWSSLIDPNGWTDDGTASLVGVAVTEDGSRLAFARSDAGSDWMTWRVVEVATGSVSADTVPWAKFSGAAWLPDGSGFVYGGYEPPEEGHEHEAANRDHRLRLHRIGTAAEDDVLVYHRPDEPEWGFSPAMTHDGQWLVIQVSRGTDPVNRIHFARVRADTGGAAAIGEVRPLLDEADARYEPIGVAGGELMVTTDLQAPLGRILAVDLLDPQRRREVVAEESDRLESAQLVGADQPGDPGWIVCRRLHHATARLSVHELSGAGVRDIDLPGPGTVASITGGRHDRAVHLTFETFAAPATVLRHDLDVGTTAEVATPTGPDPSAVVVEQVAVHHDGASVPLFVVHRSDVVPDGRAATILWGYGGFDIPVTPMFRPAWRTWVDAGGVLAVACLRGGGEYGREWHDDGRLHNKQHVFDDALACAAWLTGRRRSEVTATALSATAEVAATWTSPQHLGVEGRSNGGLLVGACLTQQPESFGTAVPEVGVLDLTRFHRFTIGWAWTSDYGSPDDPDDLAALLAYSPYHRIEPGRCYPATLITTGDTDDRVVPAHSYKFAAALQAAQGCDAPILLRVDTSAGHGLGKPVAKLLEERADVLAFHAHHLGLAVPDDSG